MNTKRLYAWTALLAVTFLLYLGCAYAHSRGWTGKADWDGDDSTLSFVIVIPVIGLAVELVAVVLAYLRDLIDAL